MKYITTILLMLAALALPVLADDKAPADKVEQALTNLVEGEQINAKSLRESLKEALAASSITAEKLVEASRPAVAAAKEQAEAEAPTVIDAYIRYRRAQAEVGVQTSRSLAAVIAAAAREIPTPADDDR